MQYSASRFGALHNTTMISMMQLQKTNEKHVLTGPIRILGLYEKTVVSQLFFWKQCRGSWHLKK
jgi:hypothetical protein